MLGLWLRLFFHFRDVEHRLQKRYLRLHLLVQIGREERIGCYMRMQEARDDGESVFRFRRVFGAHVIDDLHHLRRQHVECLGRNGGAFRHHVLEVDHQTPHVVGHLLRRERLTHQRRVRDHRLNTRLRHEVIDEAIDRVFILGVIHEHKGIRRRENFLYLRLGFRREEDSRAAGKEPRDEEKQDTSDGHRQFMP